MHLFLTWTENASHKCGGSDWQGQGFDGSEPTQNWSQAREVVGKFCLLRRKAFFKFFFFLNYCHPFKKKNFRTVSRIKLLSCRFRRLNVARRSRNTFRLEWRRTLSSKAFQRRRTPSRRKEAVSSAKMDLRSFFVSQISTQGRSPLHLQNEFADRKRLEEKHERKTL